MHRQMTSRSDDKRTKVTRWESEKTATLMTEEAELITGLESFINL